MKIQGGALSTLVGAGAGLFFGIVGGYFHDRLVGGLAGAGLGGLAGGATAGLFVSVIISGFIAVARKEASSESMGLGSGIAGALAGAFGGPMLAGQGVSANWVYSLLIGTVIGAWVGIAMMVAKE
ncbi:MAG: hypothetical protein HYY91_06940 [Candidatus Omnitrophica bacterium]|nr:hypothetical protein [Candidatus Omnitrophota bacterium]